MMSWIQGYEQLGNQVKKKNNDYDQNHSQVHHDWWYNSPNMLLVQYGCISVDINQQAQGIFPWLLSH